jgi:3-methyladenine DNA glycosylase AlkD
MTAPEFVRRVQARLQPARNPGQAVAMELYMRNQFRYLGLKRPEHAALTRALWRELKPHASERLLISSAKALWKLPEREYQYVAVDVLSRFQRELSSQSLPAVRGLIESKSWWDSVDALVGGVLGGLVARFPELRSEMDAWSIDANFWVRRAAIIHQLSYGREVDADRLFAYCARNAEDPEFFVRKAIGWALRQHARVDTEGVRRFVESHPELSNLSKREALKHL